jgi:hypothetical protein
MYRMISVEFHFSGSWLAGSAWPFGSICREFYETNLPWNCQLSDQVQYSVMGSSTSYLAWSKHVDAGKDKVHPIAGHEGQEVE